MDSGVASEVNGKMADFFFFFFLSVWEVRFCIRTHMRTSLLTCSAPSWQDRQWNWYQNSDGVKLFTIYRMWWFFKITCCWSNSALCYVTDKRPPDLLLMAIGTMIVVKPHTCKQCWKFFFCLFLVWRKYKLNVFSKPSAVTCPFCFCLWKQRLGLVQDRPQRNIEVEFFFNVF